MREPTGQIIRISAWTALLVVEVLSIIPAEDRPVIGPQVIEHAAAFAILGFLFCLGYSVMVRTAILSAVAIAGIVELSQLLASTRHARLSDFVIDASAAAVGAIIAVRVRPIR